MAGITYTYTVRAYELVNETPYWSKYEAGKSAVAKTAAPKVTVKELAYNKIQVSWNEVADAAGYRVCRRRQGETRWTELTVVSSTTTTYIDTAVEPGIKYYYTIRGYCESNGKTLWGQFRSSGVAITARTAPPALVSAKSLGYNKIRITWNAVSGADGYRVYRKVKNGTWKLIGNTSASAVTYTDGKAQTGMTSYYTVRSYCTVDGKNILGKYYVNGIKGIARLSAPTLVSAKINSTSQTKITWNTVEGATGYRIYRKTTSGSWKLIRIMRSSAATSYTDTTAKGKSYRYTVRAYRTVGEENILGSYYKNGIKSTK